jgi:uncharacterized protein with HEPN domain
MGGNLPMPMGTVRERMQLMLDAVTGLERSLTGKTFQDFVASPDLAAAVERYVERLSAALGHAPNTLQSNHPEVDWQAIATIGNLLRHVYDRSLDPRVWDVAKGNLRALKCAVLATIDEVEGNFRT